MNELQLQRQIPAAVNTLVSQVNLQSQESPSADIRFVNQGVEAEHWQVILTGRRMNLLPLLNPKHEIMSMDIHRSGANAVVDLTLLVRP